MSVSQAVNRGPRMLSGLACIASTVIGALTGSPAMALQFPGTCVSPPATVTKITGVNTQNATMEARYTLPDIIQACHEGYVDQGALPPDECIRKHRGLLESPPLHASADCVAGVVTVEGFRTKLPAYPSCATGGIRAIEAFRSLCPSYSGEIERKD